MDLTDNKSNVVSLQPGMPSSDEALESLKGRHAEGGVKAYSWVALTENDEYEILFSDEAIHNAVAFIGALEFAKSDLINIATKGIVE